MLLGFTVKEIPIPMTLRCFSVCEVSVGSQSDRRWRVTRLERR
jgi:hypothetical protein